MLQKFQRSQELKNVQNLSDGLKQNTCILFLISERASNIVERVQFPNSCIDMQSLDRVRAFYNSSTYELHYNYLAPNKIIFQD